MRLNIFAVLRLVLPQIGASMRRTAYLIVTLAVTVVAWLGLSALASPFVHADIPFVGQITVMNLQHGDTLPTRYATRMAKLPGVSGSFYQNVSPVICQRPSTTATLNGFGGPDTDQRLAESGVDAATAKAWNKDPLGVLVGSELAARCGWKAGMNIEPPGITNQPVQIHVIGVFTSEKPAENQIAFAHYDYLNRLPGLYGTRDHANVITLYSEKPSENGLLASRIESAFAHDDPPVEAMTNTTADMGLARFGRVQSLLAWVMAAIFACAAMVLISVLAHTAAQRRSQMAVMQVLGFRRGHLFVVIVVECALIVLAGAALGVGVGLVVVHLLTPLVAPILIQFVPPFWAYSYLPVWLVGLLMLSLVLPAVIVLRTRPIDYSVT